MEASFAARCPIRPCPSGWNADVETLSSALAMHLRTDHGYAMSDATRSAWTVVRQSQETALKVARMREALAEVLGEVTPVQARAVLKAMTGQGLTVRVAEGTRTRGVAVVTQPTPLLGKT